jgi:hypothetical protein
MKLPARSGDVIRRPCSSYRIAPYEKAPASLKACEELAKAWKVMASGSEVSVSKVIVRRSEIEIALEKAKDATH